MDIRIDFKSGSLFLSNLYDYSTTFDAVKAAAGNLGKTAIATKVKTVYDFSGPSWAHSQSEDIHSVSARIFGQFTKKEIARLFEYGHWYEEAKKEGFKYKIRSFCGSGSNIEII